MRFAYKSLFAYKYLCKKAFYVCALVCGKECMEYFRKMPVTFLLRKLIYNIILCVRSGK